MGAFWSDENGLYLAMVVVTTLDVFSFKIHRTVHLIRQKLSEYKLRLSGSLGLADAHQYI